MNKIILIFGFLVLTVITLISCNKNQQEKIVENTASPADVKILKSWQGDYPVNQLKLLPEGQREQGVGFIIETETFSDIWNHFKPGGDIPVIDFKANLVLFARNTQFYNRISIGKVTITDGVADVLAMETMSAMPIEGDVALSLAVVPRQGITAIKTGETKIVIK